MVSFQMRPSEDTKSFKSGVYHREDWEVFVKRTEESGYDGRAKSDTTVWVAPVKDIFREIRCWVVKGRVITASQYKIGGRVHYEECFEPEVLKFAQDMVDIYQPAEAFVIDIAIIEDGLRVIEINYINAAGFYKCNLQKLIEEFENNF